MINDWIVLWRLIFAALLSGMVGFEREFHGRAAGFRTHILLCVGSTLIMLTSMYMYDMYNGKAVVDPGRLAAGVVTGIGFLGAGTIMRYKSSVRGLTTAASLWVVTGIGLSVGAGMYFASFVTAMLAIITLLLFSRIEVAMIRKDWYKTVVVETAAGVDQLKGIREVLAEYGIDITDFEVERAKDNINMLLKLGVKLNTQRHNDQIVRDISRLDGVKYVKWGAD